MDIFYSFCCADKCGEATSTFAHERNETHRNEKLWVVVEDLGCLDGRPFKQRLLPLVITLQLRVVRGSLESAEKFEHFQSAGITA